MSLPILQCSFWEKYERTSVLIPTLHEKVTTTHLPNYFAFYRCTLPEGHSGEHVRLQALNPEYHLWKSTNEWVLRIDPSDKPKLKQTALEKAVHHLNQVPRGWAIVCLNGVVTEIDLRYGKGATGEIHMFDRGYGYGENTQYPLRAYQLKDYLHSPQFWDDPDT